MKRIKIKDIGRFSEEQFNKVIRFAVIELDARLKEGSPVDTGRFRGNWQISQNSKSVPNVFGPFQNNKGLPRSSLPPIRTNYRNEKAGNTYSIITVVARMLNYIPYNLFKFIY